MKRRLLERITKKASTITTNEPRYTYVGDNLDTLPMDLFTIIVNYFGELECHILRFVSKNCYSRVHCYARSSNYFFVHPSLITPHTIMKRFFFSPQFLGLVLKSYFLHPEASNINRSFSLFYWWQTTLEMVKIVPKHQRLSSSLSTVGIMRPIPPQRRRFFISDYENAICDFIRHPKCTLDDYKKYQTFTTFTFSLCSSKQQFVASIGVGKMDFVEHFYNNHGQLKWFQSWPRTDFRQIWKSVGELKSTPTIAQWVYNNISITYSPDAFYKAESYELKHKLVDTAYEALKNGGNIFIVVWLLLYYDTIIMRWHPSLYNDLVKYKELVKKF